MELSKVLLGAILLGIAVETSSCSKDDKTISPAQKAVDAEQNNSEQAQECLGCGMG